MNDDRSKFSTRRMFGSTGLAVSPLCIGTSPLASNAGLYGYEVSAEQAISTVLSVFDSSLNFMDTSNGYGEDGASEKRIGEAIKRAGGLPKGFVLSTKVDPDPRTGDFSGARVRRSIEESLTRLGLDRVPLLSLHDPERISFAQAAASGGPNRCPRCITRGGARREHRGRRRACRCAAGIRGHRRVRLCPDSQSILAG